MDSVNTVVYSKTQQSCIKSKFGSLQSSLNKCLYFFKWRSFDRFSKICCTQTTIRILFKLTIMDSVKTIVYTKYNKARSRGNFGHCRVISASDCVFFKQRFFDRFSKIGYSQTTIRIFLKIQQSSITSKFWSLQSYLGKCLHFSSGHPSTCFQKFVTPKLAFRFSPK